jgi:hypothetical protein
MLHFTFLRTPFFGVVLSVVAGYDLREKSLMAQVSFLHIKVAVEKCEYYSQFSSEYIGHFSRNSFLL